jgi:hypothetical protein
VISVRSGEGVNERIQERSVVLSSGILRLMLARPSVISLRDSSDTGVCIGVGEGTGRASSSQVMKN